MPTETPTWENTASEPTWDDTQPDLTTVPRWEDTAQSSEELGARRFQAQQTNPLIPPDGTAEGTGKIGDISAAVQSTAHAALDVPVQTVQDAFEYLGAAGLATGGGYGFTMNPEHSRVARQIMEAPSNPPGEIAKAVAGGQKAAVTGLAAMVDPVMLPAVLAGPLGAPVWAQRLMALGFTGQMLSHTPELARKFGEAYESGDTEKQTEALGDLLLTGAFVTTAGKHALTPNKIVMSRTLAKELLKSEFTPEAPKPVSPEVRLAERSYLPVSAEVLKDLKFAKSEVVEEIKAPEVAPVQEAVAAPGAASVAPVLPPVKPGFVRMFHGGSDPTGKLNAERDITPYYDYAKGYADKSGAPVWYVDVPENAPFMKKAFEEFEGGPRSPFINTVAPAEIMKGAQRVAEPASVAPVRLWSSASPKSGEPFYLSDKPADAESYALGRDVKQYEATPKKTFNSDSPQDPELARLFESEGGLYDAPRSHVFIRELRRKGYDSVSGVEVGAGKQSNWLVVYDAGAVKHIETPNAQTPTQPTVQPPEASISRPTSGTDVRPVEAAMEVPAVVSAEKASQEQARSLKAEVISTAPDADVIQMLQDSIETKRSNKESVPQAWIDKLGALREKQRGENPESGDASVFSDESSPSHPLNSENPILPIKLSANQSGLDTIQWRSDEAQKRIEIARVKARTAKGATRDEFILEEENMKAAQKELGRMERAILKRMEVPDKAAKTSTPGMTPEERETFTYSSHLLSPDEFARLHRLRPLANQLPAYEFKMASDVADKSADILTDKAKWNEVYEKAIMDLAERHIQRRHEGAFGIQVSQRNPVNAEAVQAYGIQLPEGYVREGNKYVFKPAVPVAKEPWEMTRAQYVAQQPKSMAEVVGNGHRVEIAKAVREGKPVPPEVLADYPDLQPKVPVAEVPKDVAQADQPTWRIPPTTAKGDKWFSTTDWRKTFDESKEIETKIDWLRAVANNRGRKSSAQDLTDVLQRTEQLLQQQKHGSLANTLWDVSLNSAASPETKARAKVLYDEFWKPESPTAPPAVTAEVKPVDQPVAPKVEQPAAFQKGDKVITEDYGPGVVHAILPNGRISVKVDDGKPIGIASKRVKKVDSDPAQKVESAKTEVELQEQLVGLEHRRRKEVRSPSMRRYLVNRMDDEIAVVRKQLKEFSDARAREFAEKGVAEEKLVREQIEAEADKEAPRDATGPLTQQERLTLNELRFAESEGKLRSEISKVIKARLETRANVAAEPAETPNVAQVEKATRVEAEPTLGVAPLKPSAIRVGIPVAWTGRDGKTARGVTVSLPEAVTVDGEKTHVVMVRLVDAPELVIGGKVLPNPPVTMDIRELRRDEKNITPGTRKLIEATTVTPESPKAETPAQEVARDVYSMKRKELIEELHSYGITETPTGGYVKNSTAGDLWYMVLQARRERAETKTPEAQPVSGRTAGSSKQPAETTAKAQVETPKEPKADWLDIVHGSELSETQKIQMTRDVNGVLGRSADESDFLRLMWKAPKGRKLHKGERKWNQVVSAIADTQFGSKSRTQPAETPAQATAKMQAEVSEKGIVARTPPVERADVNNGTRETEYRVRRVSDAERNEKWHTYGNTPWAVERRTIRKDLETGTIEEGEWSAFATGESKQKAIEDGISDTGFLNAPSLDPVHGKVVARVKFEQEWRTDKEKRLKEAIREAKWAEESALRIKDEANKKYQTALKRAGLFEKAGEGKADSAKIDAIRAKLSAQFKEPHDKAVSDAAAKYAAIKAIEAEQQPKYQEPKPQQGAGEVVPAEDKLASIVNEAIEAKSPKKLGIAAGATVRPSDVIPGVTDLRSVSPAVEARWKAAVKGTQSILDRISEKATSTWHSITREYADLPPREFPQEIDILRRLRASRNASARTTVDVLRGITQEMGPKQYDVFNRVVLLEDLAKDVESGMYADGRDLPYGYKDAGELQADLAKFKDLAGRTPQITEALKRRQEFMDSLRNTLVDRGFLPESVLKDPRYFHHQVLAYMTEKNAPPGGRTFRDWFSGWTKKRTGSSQDYNRQYVEAEAEVISDAMNKTAMQDLQGQMKRTADITKSLKDLHGEDWEQNIPKTHTKWQPKQGNVFYPVKTVAERTMEKYLEGVKDLLPEDFKDAVAIGAKKEEWVIPKGLAKVLDHMGERDQNVLDKMASAGVGGWKRMILLMPLRFAKYNLNNLSGDLDFLFAAQPKIFKEYKGAAEDMWGFHVKGKAATGDIKEAMQSGVIGSGWRASELPDIGKSEYFRWLTGQKPKLNERYWEGVTKLNDAREDAGRMAAYRFAKKEWAADRPFYGASVPKDVDALATPQLKAAKVAREILIDYGRETQAGEFMRRKVMPFFRWMHGNFARYMQLMRNIPVQEGDAGKRLAAVAGKRLATKSAGLAARMAFAYGAVNLWNHTFFPKEEEELGEGRNQLHLILGRDDDGNIQTIRFQGALSDLLGWVGGENLPQDIEDLWKGQATVGDKMKEGYEAAVSRVVNASQPFYKTAAEVGLGRSFYPNALEPRPIRDRAEHAAGLFALGNVYQWLAGKPHKPFRKELSNLISYTTDPGEAAYNATRHLAGEWLEDQGEERPTVIPGKRSNALYYYKQAVRYKDKDMAAKWLKEYQDLGGKSEGLQRSIELSHPLAMLNTKKGDFLRSLSPEQRATVQRADEWYRRVYRPQP